MTETRLEFFYRILKGDDFAELVLLRWLQDRRIRPAVVAPRIIEMLSAVAETYLRDKLRGMIEEKRKCLKQD